MTGKQKKVKTNVKSAFFIIPAGTYPFDVVCYFGTDVEWLIDQIKQNLTDQEIIDLRTWKLKRGAGWMFTNGVSLIWLPNKPTTIQETGFLLHEIWHATDEILRKIGMKLVDESTEAYAYLLQYLWVQIIDKLKISFTF